MCPPRSWRRGADTRVGPYNGFVADYTAGEMDVM